MDDYRVRAEVPWRTERGAETGGDLRPIGSGVQWLQTRGTNQMAERVESYWEVGGSSVTIIQVSVCVCVCVYTSVCAALLRCVRRHLFQAEVGPVHGHLLSCLFR